MAIKQFISFEGVEDVERELARLNKTGEDSLKTFRDIGKDAGGGFNRIVEGAKKAGLSIDETSEKTTKFGSALKTLSAGLRLVGVDIGSVGSAARLLNTTLVGTGVVAIGGAIVALGKLQEAAAKTQGELADAFGSQAKGQQAFAALEKSAQQFGTTVGNLADPLVSLQTALSNVDRTAKGFRALRAEDLPGGNVQSVKTATEALDNFIKILRAGRLTQDEAQKAAKTFFDTFRDGGPITSAALRNLPVGTLKILQEALGAGGQSAKEFFAAVDAGAVPFEKFVAILARMGPEAQKAFDTKAIKTMGDELGKVLAELNDAFKLLAGTDFSGAVIQQLNGIAKGVRDAKQEVQDLLEAEARLRRQALERLIQPAITGEIPLPRPRPEDIDKVNKGFIDARQSVDRLGAAGINAGNQLAQGANQAATAIGRVKDQADSATEAVDEFGNAIGPQGRGGEAAKGRLGQIPVFVPQLAGQGGQQSGQQFGQQWIEAVQSEIQATDVEFDINTQIDETQRTAQINIDENTLVSEANSLFEQVKQIFQQLIQLNIDVGGGATGIGGTPFARGGRVSGPGSSTSDSIWARLSNREWVINAKAVDFYGSGLFAALNSMRLPRQLAAPKFAEGGQVSAPSSSLTLVLGGRSFETTASESTVTALRRFAVHSQLASIGRKPGFVR